MFSIYLVPLLVAMFLAVNMGGSGTAPSFSASYGADLIRKDLIPGLFGVFVFAGVILAGKKVVLTIGKDVLPGELMSINMVTIILLSVALSLFFANLLRVPQSTSQSTIFALIGPALFFGVLKTDKLFYEIIPIWFITPVLAFVLTYFFGRFIYRPIKNKTNIKLKEIAKRKFIKFIVIAGGCYVAFAIGSNNVANAAGPIVAMASNELNVSVDSQNFMLIMIIVSFMIAPFFGIGSSFLGHRVLQTTSKEIVSFGPLGATLISFITASILLLASLSKGIPISLVQMNIGAIIGIGIVKTGWRQMRQNTFLKKVFTIWIIAPLIALVLSYLLTYAAFHLGLLTGVK